MIKPPPAVVTPGKTKWYPGCLARTVRRVYGIVAHRRQPNLYVYQVYIGVGEHRLRGELGHG